MLLSTDVGMRLPARADQPNEIDRRIWMNRLLIVACSVLCLVSIGCGPSGPPLGTVSGTVTMDGEPLSSALVTFTPAAGGRSSTGKTDASGKYELAFVDSKGALIGSHNVSVTTLTEVAASAPVSSDSEEYAKQAMGGGQSDYDSAKVTEPIPAKYNTATTLTFEVKPGSNTYDIPLESGS